MKKLFFSIQLPADLVIFSGYPKFRLGLRLESRTLNIFLLNPLQKIERGFVRRGRGVKRRF